MPPEKKKTIWLRKASRKLFNSTSFRANQYKQVVQKKIDLGAIHKKIEQFHSQLGKAVDDQYQAGQKGLLANKEIARLLEKTSSLKQAAILLEEEIETIRNEMPEAPTEAERTDQTPASKS